PSLSRISLCRDHISSVSAESNSASDRDESTLYTLDSVSFCFTLIRNRAHCVLEKIRPRSETEASLTPLCLRPTQSDSIASNSALSQDHVGFVSTKTESDQSLLRENRHSTLGNVTKTSYQIGAIVEDTSSFVSLCAKPELSRTPSVWNVVSSSDPLYDLDLEIEITLRRLRKARNIVVSNNNSSNSVSSSDNSSPVTNTFDSVEYSNTNNFSEPE
ncbi:hypothetical protein CR513_03493, partial [Mucuna pruriens]